MSFNYIESFSSSYVSNLSQQETARDLYKRALAFDLERANENQKQEILGYLNQAIELDPSFPGAYIARGTLNAMTEQQNNFKIEDNSRRE